MIRSLFGFLDSYGLEDPDNNEGFIEDRCSYCDRPVVDHTAEGLFRARWRHRRAALSSLILDRPLELLSRLRIT